MTTYVKRASEREIREAAVQVMSCRGTGGYSREKSFLVPAKLMNQSADGLCFEMDQTLEPGSMISVKMVTPETGKPNAYRLHRGRVRWCRKLATLPSPRYGVGVRVYESVVQTVLNLPHPDLS